MAKEKLQFVCNQCGHVTNKWAGQCTACKQWNCIDEVKIHKPKSGQTNRFANYSGDKSIQKLGQVSTEKQARTATDIKELDRVLGGGLVPGSLILLGGDPGIGKSTLMLQIARSSPSLNLLYVAGEESPGQIRQRADRIGAGQSNMKILATTEVDQIVTAVQKERPDLLIIDSIQTVYRSRLDGLPGSVQQIRECAALFQQLAKKDGITTILVGHVTKDGEIAGPRILEHMVDTVLQFEGDRSRL